MDSQAWGSQALIPNRPGFYISRGNIHKIHATHIILDDTETNPPFFYVGKKRETRNQKKQDTDYFLKVGKCYTKIYICI